MQHRIVGALKLQAEISWGRNLTLTSRTIFKKTFSTQLYGLFRLCVYYIEIWRKDKNLWILSIVIFLFQNNKWLIFWGISFGTSCFTSNLHLKNHYISDDCCLIIKHGHPISGKDSLVPHTTFKPGQWFALFSTNSAVMTSHNILLAFDCHESSYVFLNHHLTCILCRI